MTTVVDSNIIASLALPTPYTPQATQLMELWNNTGERLIAPLLFEYELVSILRRSVALGLIDKSTVEIILTGFLSSRVLTVIPTRTLHQEALQLAERLGQHKAYDAHYLALASRENAPLWTADRRLAHAARDTGLEWVHWIGELTIDHHDPLR